MPEDLRSFLAMLEAAGELERASGAPVPGAAPGKPDEGRPAERPARWLSPPAIAAVRAVTGLFGSPRRLALGLDLDPTATLEEIAAGVVARLGQDVDARFVAPSAAACKQVVLRGVAADPRRFCPGDGVGSARARALLVMGRPALGESLIGLAEVTAADHSSVSANLHAELAGPRLQAALAAAEHGAGSADVAMVLGNEPAVCIGAFGLFDSEDRYGTMSRLKGSPVVVSECEGAELEVPARAEVVLEGQLVALRPVGLGVYELNVALHTITHRRDPVIECWQGERPLTALLTLLRRG